MNERRNARVPDGGALSRGEQGALRRRAMRIGSKREITRLLRGWAERQRRAAAGPRSRTVMYELALCACWRRELLRRRGEIDVEATQVALAEHSRARRRSRHVRHLRFDR